jgi:hypothetical protein
LKTEGAYYRGKLVCKQKAGGALLPATSTCLLRVNINNPFGARWQLALVQVLANVSKQMVELAPVVTAQDQLRPVSVGFACNYRR